MLKATLNKFRLLPDAAKSLIYLYNIHAFVGIITGIFFNIFVYIQLQSLLMLVLYNIIFFTGCFFGFVVYGYLISHFRISLKYNHLRAFVIDFCALLFLLFTPHTFPFLMTFGAMTGISLGVFWIGHHAYELSYTDNLKNRDFYLSVLYSAEQAMAVLAPFIATASFILAEKVFRIETFQLVFIILPLIYLFSLPFLFKLPDYVPEKINWNRLKSMFGNKKFQDINKYYYADSFLWSTEVVMFPIIAIIALGNVINIGLFETVAGILSIVFLMIFSNFRKPDNRLIFLGIAVTVNIVGLSILFYSNMALYAYIIYSIVIILIGPFWGATAHVLDLYTVELMNNEKITSYTGLIYRDFILWVGRVLALLILGGIFFFVNNEILTVKYAIFQYGLASVFSFLAIRRVLKLGKN